MEKVNVTKITGKTVYHVLRGKPVIINVYRRPMAFLARLPEDGKELEELIEWLRARIVDTAQPDKV